MKFRDWGDASGSW